MWLHVYHDKISSCFLPLEIIIVCMEYGNKGLGYIFIRKERDWDATDGYLCILARNHFWLVKYLEFEFWKKKFFPSRRGEGG